MAGTHDDGKTGDTLAWAARNASGVMSPFKFTRCVHVYACAPLKRVEQLGCRSPVWQ